MYVYVRHGLGRFYSRIKINKVLDIENTTSRKRSGGFLSLELLIRCLVSGCRAKKYPAQL